MIEANGTVSGREGRRDFADLGWRHFDECHGYRFVTAGVVPDPKPARHGTQSLMEADHPLHGLAGTVDDDIGSADTAHLICADQEQVAENKRGVGDVDVRALADGFLQAVGQVSDRARHALARNGQHRPDPLLVGDDVDILGLQPAEDGRLGG